MLGAYLKIILIIQEIISIFLSILIGLLGIKLRRIVRIDKGIEIKLAHAHVIIKFGLFKCPMLIHGCPDLFNQVWQNPDESIATTLFKIQFEMAVSWQKVLIGSTAAL